jgi:hypothetical protein
MARVVPAAEAGSTPTKLIVKVTAKHTVHFALYKLATQPVASSVVRPKDYFAASNELTCMSLAICWTVTLAYDYKLVWNHPARNYVGHLNPCFGWDFPPASYIGIMLAGVDVFFAMRYANLEAMRTRLLDIDNKLSWSELFALVTSYLHALAAVLWLLLWQVGPPNGDWISHLAIFSTCSEYSHAAATLRTSLTTCSTAWPLWQSSAATRVPLATTSSRRLAPRCRESV